ncbi:hypothetical protein F5Y19DRAFT_151338 [Xylariaceae sp. FL1651]|nr:hypothetical protein F5Y19DRAFT_151338 [Xylariaceae sp. FL1651]
MSTNTRNGTEGTLASEQDPLLPLSSKTSSGSRWARLRTHLNEDVTIDRTDLVLLYAYFLTGLLDTSATAIWHTFVSMQTGNTVFLALGLAGPATSSRWIKSGISLVSFCLGSCFFAHIHYAIHPRRRWVLLLSIVIQVLFVLAAALIVAFTPVTEAGDSNDDLHWHVLLPLALIAFQSSGQAVVSRVLRHRTLTSVALTSIYCDLFSDAELLAGLTSNVERNRRAAAAVLLFIGALTGGAWSRMDIGMTGAIWTAVVMKSFYIPVWLFWKKERMEEEEEADDALINECW